MAHYDAANTAVTSNSGPESKPEEEWTVEFDGEPTIPVVDNGVAYVGVRNDQYYAIDVQDGEIIWEYDTVFSDTPAVSEGIIYFSGNGIEAVSKNGDEEWTSGHESLTNIRFDSEVIYGSNGDRIIGLEKGSGEEVLEISAPGEVKFLAVDEHYLYANSSEDNEDDHHIEAYDKQSEKLIWDYQTSDPWNGQFTVVDDDVYAVDDRSFISIDTQTGDINPIKEFDPETGASPRSPTVWNDTAYIPLSIYTEFPAINLTGETPVEEWEYDGAIAAWKIVVAEAQLYVWGSTAAPSGLTLYAVDPKTGDVNWEHQTTGAESPGVPVVLEDIIIYSNDGEHELVAVK